MPEVPPDGVAGGAAGTFCTSRPLPGAARDSRTQQEPATKHLHQRRRCDTPLREHEVMEGDVLCCVRTVHFKHSEFHVIYFFLYLLFGPRLKELKGKGFLFIIYYFFYVQSI